MQAGKLMLGHGGTVRVLRDLARSDSALAALVIVVLPNILFLLVSPWFLLRRVLGPLIYLFAAILALVLPKAFAFPIFLLAAALDACFLVFFLFDMPLDASVRSLQYFGNIDILASLLYLGAIVYFVAVALLLAVLFGIWRERLRNATLVPALVLAALVAWFDYGVNGFKPLTRPDFESALASVGFDAETIVARDRNLLIVMVEGMGAYADPAAREILAGRLRRAAEGRFAYSTGTVNHYGSTTGAESRELCGQWNTFTHYLAQKEHDCLPGRLAAAGYATSSYHASYGALFSRPVWYPRIGFQKLNFREDIERERPEAVARHCGTVFPGLCDEDVGNIVHADLLAPGSGNKLLYWLTLDSHLPYVPNPANPLKCGTSEAEIRSRVPCDLTGIWLAVFDKVAEIAADPQTPPVDILVVGDHNTPMWSRDAYRHFVNGKVDWYFLKDMRPSGGSNEMARPRGASRVAASG